MSIASGREREATLIRQANRAAAVGRLMLNELNSWHEFLEADVVDLANLPRRQLKAGKADVRARLSTEIRTFCNGYFEGMDERKLSLLYEEIKAHRGLELPLAEFEQRFARLRPSVLKGHPKHVTVVISLWGLQFKSPEEMIAKDLIEGLYTIRETQKALKEYEGRSHWSIQQDRERVSALIRKQEFGVRATIVSCFNLIEGYLNGLAWDYVQTNGTAGLSNNRKKLLEDASSVSTREKLFKYPEAVTGRQLWEPSEPQLQEFADTLKPYRDALVHPSPFSVPARFGGHDKLRLFYRADAVTATRTVIALVDIVKRIHGHVYGTNTHMPEWIRELEAALPDQ